MANQQDADPKRRVRRRRRSYSELESAKPRKSQISDQVTYEADVPEPRAARVQRLERSQSQTRTAAIATMTSESSATLQSSSASRHERSRRTGSASHGQKHRRRRRSSIKEDGPTDYVYDDSGKRSRTSRVQPVESSKSREEELSSDTEDEQPAARKQEAKGPKTRKVRVIYITEEADRAGRRKDRRTKDSEPLKAVPKSVESVRRRRASTTSKRRDSVDSPPIALPKRSTSTSLPTNTRPSVKRSNTTTSHASAKALHEPTSNGVSTKRSSFIGSFFGPPVKQVQEPEKLVECLTCLSDDIPRSKSAKLKCGHRMCHSCLRRIFKLSVTDPQHMPPKCCTADHIPLKHVERLFDINFKKLWNRKFQEYSTKNRIYCPGRRCGEWIKPGNIHKEDGRKYGKCSRCKTKVCCLCNGKWHGNKECPKDEETNRLLATAKDEGWQRCYNCRTMVELKEGCNHMTCHCTAEFCMICGLKWKTCNCPWFNYDAVEADRLDHMRVPEPVAAGGEAPAERGPRIRRHRPPDNYRDEVTERRRQERMDEALARRLQRAALHDGDGDDYQGGIGDINGIGNGAGHFMNQDYVRAAHNILTGTFDQATAAANYVMGVAQARGRPPPPPEPRRMAGRYPVAAPPPLQRRHSERAQNQTPGRDPQPQDNPPPSVLAGLGDRRGGNRVSAWRRHVEPGVTPAEGVLSA